jgi:hypothetical protein
MKKTEEEEAVLAYEAAWTFFLPYTSPTIPIAGTVSNPATPGHT